MTGTHIIINIDPQAVLAEVDKFTDKKAGAKKFYNVHLIAAANGQAIAYTSCLIMWECSDEDWRSFLFSQKMTLQKS